MVLIHLIEVVRKIEEALGTHEKAARHFRQPRQTHGLGCRRVVQVLAENMVTVAASDVESGLDRNRLEQRRLPRAVLAHDDGNRPLEIESQFAALERWDREGKLVRLNPLLKEAQSL